MAAAVWGPGGRAVPLSTQSVPWPWEEKRCPTSHTLRPTGRASSLLCGSVFPTLRGKCVLDLTPPISLWGMLFWRLQKWAGSFYICANKYKQVSRISISVYSWEPPRLHIQLSFQSFHLLLSFRGWLCVLGLILLLSPLAFRWKCYDWVNSLAKATEWGQREELMVNLEPRRGSQGRSSLH